MSRRDFLRLAAAGTALATGMDAGLGPAAGGASGEAEAAPARAVWDLSKAYQESTPTRGRVCINGLWRWQPAKELTEPLPADKWGYLKVPGCWPGRNDPFSMRDSQTVHPHPSWQSEDMAEVTAAWHQREITIPKEWAGRRITLCAEYLNSASEVYIDGRRVGEMLFPSGELDLTSVCQPGGKYLLSMLVAAVPLRATMVSFADTATARVVRGRVARRGLCGDLYLVGAPVGARITDVRVTTSVRRHEITVVAGLEGLSSGARHALRADIAESGRKLREFTSASFTGADLQDGRISFAEKWQPEKLWDIHTPQNMYQLSLSLVEAGGEAVDAAHPVRFGFREFWIEGRDFYLNGSRLFLSAVPLDNGQMGALWASYAGAKESLRRLKSFGINFVYTHNYSSQPGTHLSFEEILRAADDLGMLVSLSQPHFRQYEWQDADADQSNGYARHAEFYVRVAGSHPAVVCYSMSHNANGYTQDMNPDMIDGIADPRDERAGSSAQLALRAQAIVEKLDPSRIVYHHASGNLGTMHTSNFYPNFAPIQELCDWFEHWASVGVKPAFTCEYGAPFIWDWTMYRGWYRGTQAFGSAAVPWEFCLAEWLSQFVGDEAFQISEMEKTNLRWEAEQFRAGKLWHHWDYPYEVGSRVFDERQPVMAKYLTDNWRAYRTWGLSGNSPWQHDQYWRLRPGVARRLIELPKQWENLQRPGFSPDYIEQRYERYQEPDQTPEAARTEPRWTSPGTDVTYERMDLDFEASDWSATTSAQALLRNNLPLLAYIAGKPARFTSKDHNFHPGDVVEKQLIVINNSREPVSCDCAWFLRLPQAVTGSRKVTVMTGDQGRIPLRVELPAALAPGSYQLTATFRFSSGESQTDSFSVHVLPLPRAPQVGGRIALFDPKGETGRLLSSMGVRCEPVEANTDLAPYDLLIVGRGALTADGPGPDLSRVSQGLKVILFEQSSEALEQRLGFRVAEYGLRQVFRRVPDHPILAGLELEHLQDWRGEATLLLPRLAYQETPRLGQTVKWCGIEVPRAWRCGNRGNVASVLIEKPARGSFLPLLDGGYSLQYSPLLEYRQGNGMILFCQLDVTGRSEPDPAAERLARNLLQYAVGWKPAPRRKAVYVGDPAGWDYLEGAGVSLDAYQGGDLSGDQVLIVGPGGPRGRQQRARSAAAIGSWLEAGGNLLAIGLDEAAANAFLPFQVSMQKAEHIAAFFEPFGRDSLLAGVSPAEVHNRDPRELSLVTGGATVVGNGVLATGGDANVVFCQLAPWEFEYQKQMNLKRTYRRVSAMVGRLLANMGVEQSTPLLARFGSPVTPGNPGRWLEGLYLDQPEESDDPYRFFRW